MKKDLIELVFILDKSGSMSGKEEDVVGGFNATLNSQKDNNALVTTVLFSNTDFMLIDRKPIKEVKELKRKDFVVGGCTALIDAIGNNIKHIETIHKYAENKPNKTLFVIMTDGLENASTKYSSDEIKKKIEKKKEEGWEFLFLGANIDAVETTKMYGIREDRSINYHNDKRGIKKSFGAIKEFIHVYNECSEAELDKGNWRKEVDADYKSR